ncbi:MAG TPA: adenylate/guanylate cyclase domain-containing protein [Saprospiraceae bacterium]|nr:adenylate/guanylate cyclase domain-containing protein [Saprospiraceae bacterium]
MTKILVADDEIDVELLIKQKFRKEIRDGIFEFIFALNGKEALKILQEKNDIDLVLSDINMPEMDGLTLLSHINEVAPLVKTVMVSAYGDLDNIRSAMNKGAFDFVFKPINFEDLRTTIEKTIISVQHIKEKVQAVRQNNILKMYVDESVLKYMESNQFEEDMTECETIEATVVFIDICGFTRISEQEPAVKVIKLLNEYFDIMVKEIINQDGIVDKFIGDAIMAVFKGDQHAQRAIRTSINVRNALSQTRSWEHLMNFIPQVSIGLNSGEMFSGNVGCISLKRFDYTVIGDAVNVAARLQGIAENGQILVNEDMYRINKDHFKFSERGIISLKNKEKPLVIYEVIE